MFVATYLMAVALLGHALAQLVREPRMDTRIFLIVAAGCAKPTLDAIEDGHTAWFWVYLAGSLAVFITATLTGYGVPPRWRGGRTTGRSSRSKLPI
jgi:hypothetical protein